MNKNLKLKIKNLLLPCRKFTVHGASMSPTLNPGDTVFASPLPYFFKQPKINDIVVCLDPRDKEILIKRVSKIENGKFFVVGDNKLASTDSKNFGFLHRRDIIGKVLYKL